MKPAGIGDIGGLAVFATWGEAASTGNSIFELRTQFNIIPEFTLPGKHPCRLRIHHDGSLGAVPFLPG